MVSHVCAYNPCVPAMIFERKEERKYRLLLLLFFNKNFNEMNHDSSNFVSKSKVFKREKNSIKNLKRSLIYFDKALGIANLRSKFWFRLKVSKREIKNDDINPLRSRLFRANKLETISRMKLLYFILRIKKVKLSLLNIKLCIVISRDIL